MKIILTLLCRNEADIIASIVDFHLSRGVDFILATDNGSIDGTVAILESYQRRGVLRLLHEPSYTHDQAVWVSRMARLAAEEHGADWVIPSDADEFWWPASGSFHAELGQVPPDRIALQVDRVNFLPPPANAPSDLPFHQVQTLRERQSRNSLGDPLPPKVCHRADPAITVTDGNHTVLLSGEPLWAQRGAVGLEILHFPVRSYRQLERKIRDGAQALARNTRVPAHVGMTWRRLYRDHLLAGTLPAYYDSLRPDQETLASVLASGEVLEDRRLQRDFSQFSPTNTDSP